MGIVTWWRNYRLKAELNRRSVALNEDETIIAEQIPELAGMGFVNGGAYTLEAIRLFRQSHSQEQQSEFSRRLVLSQEDWSREGLTMPYWGNLWVLRRYEADLAEPTAPD